MPLEDSPWLEVTQGHLAAGRLAEAERSCLTRLEAAPQHAWALSLLSFVRMKQQRWDEAEATLRAAVAYHPTNASLHATYGNLCLMRGKPADAVAPLQACVLLDPRAHQQRAQLVALYEHRTFARFDEDAKRAMLACLADDDVTHSLMARAWVSLLRLDPSALGILHLFASADYETFRAAVSPELMRAWQEHELLIRGLDRFVVAELEIERGLTFARRWLASLGKSHGKARGEEALAGFLPGLCTLARYCFMTEYVFAQHEHEHAAEETTGRLAAPIATATQAALLACYEPLHAHADARRLATLSDTPHYRALARVQIHEALKERKIKSTIAVLAPIADDVSRAVGAQYEENPYPRWVTVGRAAVAASVAAEARGKQILVAGCGTGREAIESALIFPAARVDAIDLSRTSLAYAIRKSRELGTRNLFFMQGDILDLDRLDKRFDLVLCSGVLHHMEAPVAGLRACLDVLRPGGLLKLALYSRMARADITVARAWAEQHGFPPTLAGIRSFREAVMALPPADPMRQRLVGWEDFYSTSGCRDLVFHVREHAFTLPEIADIVRDLELSLVQFDTQNPAHRATYRDRFPEDPEALDLSRWHALEQERPAMFAGMYRLSLCRSADRDELDTAWMKDTQRM